MKRSRFGLRPRLAAWIALIIVISVGGSYAAIYRGTSTDLRSRIDSDLSSQAKSFQNSLPANVSSRELAVAARKYINKQRFQATPRIFVVQILNGSTVTNEADVIKKEIGEEGETEIEEESRHTDSAVPLESSGSTQKERDTGTDQEQLNSGAEDQGDTETTESEREDAGPESLKEKEDRSKDGSVGGSDGEDEPSNKDSNESNDRSENKDEPESEDQPDGDTNSLIDPLGTEVASAKSRKKTILNAPIGFSEVSIEEAGKVRILSQSIKSDKHNLGTFRVGQPLKPVEEAQIGLQRTFLFVGGAALLMAIVLAYTVATRTSRPLRRMAKTAESVSGGDLSRRIDYSGARDEVGVLAQAFDQMLDRIERTFQRERAFLSDVSHELRTPLTVVRGQIEVLARKGQPSLEEVDRTAKTVTKEVERMDRLVDDLKLLARAEEGSLLQLSTVDCREFFSELLDSLTLLGEREWRLSAAANGQLLCDPDQVAQIVRNLVRNAVEHTAPGSVISVDVSVENDKLLISVSDEGTGIESQQLDHIFDRFYRTDSSRSRHSGGTGLGLAIVKALVEAHGGRIWAESTEGEGTTVSFELPGYSAGSEAQQVRQKASEKE